MKPSSPLNCINTIFSVDFYFSVATIYQFKIIGQSECQINETEPNHGHPVSETIQTVKDLHFTKNEVFH